MYNTTTHLLGNGEVVTKHYNNKNQLHNPHGPALSTQYSKEWLIDGIRHRNDGPAIFINKPNYIRAEWWLNGVLHRDNNKPAIIDSDGTVEYWINGIKQS